MQLICQTQALVEAVSNVQRAVSGKTTIPALEGILFQTSGDKVSLTGYDLELGISTNIQAQVQREGRIVLPAKMLGDLVRKLPGDEVSLTVDNKGNTVIVSDATEFTIMGIDAADYPEMPAVNDGVGLTLPQNLLRSMIRQTLFAVAQTNVRPIQTGVLFLLKDCLLQLVAVDGQRLAMRSEKVESTGEMNFVVPGKTLSEVLKLLEDEDSSMTMAVGRRHIVMEIGGYAVISRLLDGEFIPYQRAIPQNITTTVRVNTRSFIDSVDRAALVTNDRLKAPLVCTFSDNKVRVYCSTPLGRVNDALSATIEGKEEEMGFNSRFLLDALRNTEADEVRVELAGALQPMKILPVSGDNFLFLVLPVRLPNHNRNV